MQKQQIRRILIMTKSRFIGDTLLAIPTFRAARRRWPDAHITLLTGGNANQLLQNNPYVDEIVLFDPTRADSGLGAFFAIVSRLRAGRFDLCLSLNRSFQSALLPWLAGIRMRAGFASEGRGALLNCPVYYDPDKSEIACYFDVLRAVAPDIETNSELELWLSDEEQKQADELLCRALGDDLDGRILVGIQPGASLPEKRWPAARFAVVADELAAHDDRISVVMLGGPDEKAAADEMYAACSGETQKRIMRFVGVCNLRGSLGLVARMNLFIGNDTAVTHSAVALGVPAVALFGPTNPRKWGNYGERQRVIESPDGSMPGIAVSDVMESARELLARL